LNPKVTKEGLLIDRDEMPFTALFGVALDPDERRTATIDVTSLAAEIFPYRSSGRRDKVLILAAAGDKHADAVALHLVAGGTGVVRFDIEHFPESSTMSLHLGALPHTTSAGHLDAAAGRVPLEDIRSVWLRPDLGELFGLDPPASHLGAFVRRECQGAFDGLATLLDDAFWVSTPASLYGASPKVRQLKVAAELGFPVPRTLVTNDPEAARRFVDSCGGDAVVKAFRGVIGPLTDPRVVFTSRVVPERFTDLPLVRNAPCLFQERVPNDGDVRVTAVGRTLFAVDIGFDPQDVTDADWRKVERPDTTYRPLELPASVERGCHALMDHFGLAAGTIDLIRRPDGQYVFLEINPQANWLWLEVRTGLPISQAMAQMLARGSSDG
jgi:glutathione synthase/RimK-type ligase-like ATP-grasp enzyme